MFGKNRARVLLRVFAFLALSASFHVFGIDRKCLVLESLSSKLDFQKNLTEPELIPAGSIYDQGSIIIDSQLAVSLLLDKLGLEMNAVQRSRSAWLQESGGTTFYLTSKSRTELHQYYPNNVFSRIGLRSTIININRISEDYQNIYRVLYQHGVGGTKKGSWRDRQIIADAFFTDTQDGVTPTFVTADKGIYNALLRIAYQKEAGRYYGKVAESFPEGFSVEIFGKKLRVIALQ